MPPLSIVIPVYNSEKILDELIKQIENNLGFVDGYEIILVNDCSSDNSWEKIKKNCGDYNFVKGINLRKNVGQHNAVMAGLNYADGDVIIMMDDDLQHDPKYLEALYEGVIEGYDVCYARFANKKHKLWKKLGSKFNDFVANILLDKPKDLYLSSFKAISSDIGKTIIKYDGPYPYVDGLLLSTTSSFVSIDIEHKERLVGDGGYTLRSSLSLWLKMATSFSVLPLRISTYIGFVISIFSYVMGVYYILLRLFSDAAPDGWTSLMVVILFIGGIQLFSIGIIGEYVGRSYLKINNKPQYSVKEMQ